MNNNNNRFNFLSSIAACLLWGSWAYFTNYDFGNNVALKSGLTQGASSFIVTLIVAQCVTYLFHLFPKTKTTFFLPAIFTIAGTAIALFTIHSIIHTPKILYTIAPSLIVGSIFCLLLTVRLRRMNQKIIITQEVSEDLT